MSLELDQGTRLRLEVRAIAHGGEGIADAPDGRVVFVRGAIPGDTVEAEITRVKKRWARAETVHVLDPSPDRVVPSCPAAAAGAGCCDFTHVAPEAQLRLKAEVLTGQLRTLSVRSGVLGGFDLDQALEAVQLQPVVGWRTRVRLGVDKHGRAGMRITRSTEIVAGEQCTQVAPGLLDGVVGAEAPAFNPEAELVAVADGAGERHVVSTQAARRGGRTERIREVLEGSGEAVEFVDGREFRFPATAFWQAHTAAPQTYSDIIASWGAGEYSTAVGWDLYGGVGAFVPAISRAIGNGRVESVDYSAAATSRTQPALAGLDVRVAQARVEEGIGQLSAPGLVVLDPPRTGAGADVIRAIAQAEPERIIHVGCDPATFARDLASFGEAGYAVKRMTLIDAFPATHHFESIAMLEPAHRGDFGAPGRGVN